MSLEDSWDDTGGDKPEDNYSWKADWVGDEGTITTGCLPDSFDPHDFSEVLQRLGYEPGEIRMELVSASRWEQRSAVRDEDGRKTGETTSVYLNAYKYRAVRDTFTINLPALYAEIRATKPGKPKPKPSGRTAVVCWADIQTGKVDHRGGYSELMTRLEDKRAELKEWLKSAKVDHVVIADVGDIVEGFENIPSQIQTNCLSLQDQVDIAATEFWKAIRICEKFAPVDVLSIPSNHCQWRKGKGLAGRPNDDWGIHISKRLEHLNDEVGLQVAFHRPPNDWTELLHFDIRGTILGLAHGHQANSPAGIEKWWMNLAHKGVLYCDVLLTGHFHFPTLRPSGRDAKTGRSQWHIQASTLDNGSAWVRNKMGEDGDPALTVFVIDDEGFDVRSFALL